MTTPSDLDGLTSIQRAAIAGSVFIAGEWGLTTRYENHPDIMEGLCESIADCVSGILTPKGVAILAALRNKGSENG